MASSKYFGLGLTFVALLVGCGNASDETGGEPGTADLPTPDAAPTAWPTMKQSIGPNGGTIEGAKGTAFEGLKLVVPAHSLSKNTEITITQSEVSLPLPVGARRVGTQFTFAPSSAKLAIPAELTLPASPEEVISYAAETSDMKVWLLADGAWTKSDAAATATGIVTIEMPALTTAAAGVKLSALAPICGAACVKSIACTQGVGFCLTSFGALNPAPEDSLRSFVVTQNELYWMTASTLGSAAARQSFNASSFIGSATVSPRLLGLAFARNNPAVRSSNGSYWIGTSATGNAVFGFDGITTGLFTHLLGSSTAFLGYGAVEAGSDFAMLTNGVDSSGNQNVGTMFDPPRGQFSIQGVSPAVVPTNVAYRPLPSPASAGTYVFWTSVDASGNLADSQVFTNDLDESSGFVGRGIGPRIETSSRILYLDLAPDGSIAALTRDVNVPDYVAIWKNDKLVSKVSLPAPLSVGRFAFDSLGGLWIGANNAAQVFHLAANGTDLESVMLSNAAAGTDDATNAVPLRILATNEPGSVLIITLGAQIFHGSFGVAK